MIQNKGARLRGGTVRRDVVVVRLAPLQGNSVVGPCAERKDSRQRERGMVYRSNTLVVSRSVGLFEQRDALTLGASMWGFWSRHPRFRISLCTRRPLGKIQIHYSTYSEAGASRQRTMFSNLAEKVNSGVPVGTG